MLSRFPQVDGIVKYSELLKGFFGLKINYYYYYHHYSIPQQEWMRAALTVMTIPEVRMCKGMKATYTNGT